MQRGRQVAVVSIFSTLIFLSSAAMTTIAAVPECDTLDAGLLACEKMAFGPRVTCVNNLAKGSDAIACRNRDAPRFQALFGASELRRVRRLERMVPQPNGTWAEPGVVK